MHYIYMTNKLNVIDKLDTNKSTSEIVVADDNRDNLDFIGFILDALNLKYYFANDGKAAFDLVNKKLPDLVLLDVVMPKMDGMEVNTLIKANSHTSHIPTIAITGLTEQKHIEKIQNVGFDDYIIKPFTIENLEAKLKHFLKIG